MEYMKKENVERLLDISHALTKKELSYLKIHSKELLSGKVYPVYNNNKHVSELMKYLDYDEVSIEQDNIICRRLCNIVDSFRSITSLFKEIRPEEVMVCIYGTVDTINQLRLTLKNCIRLLDKYHDVKYTQFRNFIMEELIPFKLKDYDIYHELIKDNNQYFEAVWNLMLTFSDNFNFAVFSCEAFKSMIDDEMLGKEIEKAYYDYIGYQNNLSQEEINSLANDFDNVIIDKSLEDEMKKDISIEDVSGLSPVYSQQSLDFIMNLFFANGMIHTTYEIEEDELCYLKEDMKLNIRGEYRNLWSSETGVMKNTLQFIYLCNVEEKEFTLFKILNSKKPRIFGIHDVKEDDKTVSILKIDIEKGKYYFDEFK